MNEIKIEGNIYSKEPIHTSNGKVITPFGLAIYNGKKDGKTVYDFIDCKYFGSINISDKTKVVVTGWIGVESWEKDGKTNRRTVIYAKEIQGDITKGMTKPKLENTEVFDDEIPWD